MAEQRAELSDPQLLHPAGDPISAAGLQTLYHQPLIAGRGMLQLMEYTSQTHLSAVHLPADMRRVFLPPEAAELEHFPVLLVEGDLVLNLHLFHRQQMLQIQFIAQKTEEGHIAPGGQRGIAQSLGMRCRGNMGAEGGLGVEIGQAVLDLQPLDGIRVIGAPDLGREAQHAQIKPIAAGSTAFQQDMRPGPEDPPQNIVQTQNIGVGFPAQSCGMAVHIPLHIGDVGAVQHTAHRLHNIIPHVISGQIQQQLMAAVQRRQLIA